MVDGELVRQALVERAVDAQQMYNYWLTTASEVASMQSKAPWIGPEDAFEGYEEQWGMANTKPLPYIKYKSKDEAGQPIQPPQRNSPDVPVDGLLNQANLCLQNMRQVMGIADPLQNLQVDDSQSGRAILAKERMAATSTFHFVDNLSRAIGYTGEILLDLMPKIYDTPRALQLLKEDGTKYIAQVNQSQPQMDPSQPPEVKNDLTSGRYSTIVSSGPSFASKRAEFVNSVMELSATNESVWPAIGDLAVKHMDWPGAEDASESLLALAPPPIQALRAAKSKDPLVISLGQQLQAMQQQMQQMQQAAGAKIQELGQENQKLQSQIYVGQTQTAAAKLAAQQAVGKANNVAIKAQADIITQQMESADVQSQEQNDRVELAHRISMDKAEFALQFLDRVLKAAELQQKQMQPIGPEVGQLEGEIGADARRAPNIQ